MKAMQNTGNNSDNSNSDIIITNDINNENFGVTVRPESDRGSEQGSRLTSASLNGRTISARLTAGRTPDIGQPSDATAKKSSNRNAINFMVLGYFLLVLIVIYGYFGSLVSDVIGRSNQTTGRDLNATLDSQTNATDAVIKSDGKHKKFYNTITSTELIVILWLTLIYGSALLLYLRFTILRLERDPNKPKKKKDSSDDFNEFLLSNRRNKQSFKSKVFNSEQIVNDNSDQPFWKK